MTIRPITRRAFLGMAAPAALCASGWPATPAFGPAAPLREIAVSRGLLYGSNVRSISLADDPAYAALVARECGVFVCSRAHWDNISPKPDETRFAPIDADEAWAAQHRMKFRGHCLVWHERVPGWFAELADRAAAVGALEQHVATTSRHFAGRMHSWDVVNEAIKPTQGRPDGLRNSVFIDKIGPDFLDIAFRAARQNDPVARLVYNDYNLELDLAEHEDRRRALLRLLDGFAKRGTPIDAVGLQSHLSIDGMRHFDEKLFAAFLRELAGRGLAILITELDAIDRDAPSDIARRDAAVAEIYRRYLDAALADRTVAAVITWGLTDRYGWIVSGDEPRTRRRDGLKPRPLPFDADCQPKPAYAAIAEALARAAPR
jgi:endo-1,4-beta-xylanase